MFIEIWKIYVIIFFCIAVRSLAALQFTPLANSEKVRKSIPANNSLQKNSQLLSAFAQGTLNVFKMTNFKDIRAQKFPLF